MRLPKKKLRILIADDHEMVRQGLRRVLETRPDWEVCGEAANGRRQWNKPVASSRMSWCLI